ncbi:MAG: exo-1,3-beta-glucanase [Bathelium mastoideum]|nr:MAG: exo-1,3-beta-glucanase [Bathelium mastoideum]
MYRLSRFLLLATCFASSVLARHAAHHVHKRETAGLPSQSASPSSPSQPSTSSGNATNGTDADFLYGVNIGGWLVLESWMNKDIFQNTTAYDQWTFDNQTSINPQPLLEQHWSTWFTEQDVIQIKKWGFNALRIPIGFWAFDPLGFPYRRGAEVYLDKAIGWARTHGMKVWVDHHGVPGSQNGFDNSGHNGSVQWQDAPNYQNSIDILVRMATKYGSKQYADVVVGLELVNEPISWTTSNGEGNDFGKMQSWAQQAYSAVKNATTNPHLRVIMHDAFKTPFAWNQVASKINGKSTLQNAPFGIDTHLYQNQESSDSQLSNDQHISKACNYSTSSLLPQSPTQNVPVYVGEWSTSINICVNPDGSTSGGYQCSTNGCQCTSNVDPSQYKQYTADAIRQFAEAQLLTFRKSAQGFFLWAYKGPGEWGLTNAMAAKTLPNPINDMSQYKYKNICQGQ